MNKTGWILLGVTAYFILSKNAAAGGSPSTQYAPGAIGPPNLMTPPANPLADPCYQNSPVYDPYWCQQMGRTPYAS